MIFVDKNENLLEKIILDTKLNKKIIIFRGNLNDQNNVHFKKVLNINYNTYIYCPKNLALKLELDLKKINFLFKILSALNKLKLFKRKVMFIK